MGFLNIGYLLTLNAHRYPDKTAIIFQDQHITYRELNRKVNKLAHGLMAMGLKKGDRICYLFRSGIQIAELYYAIQKIGAVAVALNHRLGAGDIASLLERSQCRAFIYHEQFDHEIDGLKERMRKIEWLVRAGTPAEGEIPFTILENYPEESQPEIEIEDDDLCRIQFTGGTTGQSKGVLRTQIKEIYQIISITISLELGGPERVMLTQSPLCHQAGLSWLNVAIGAGNTFVICDSFEPEKILKEIQEHKVTNIMLLPPSVYHRIFELPSLHQYDLSSVKSIHSSAGGTSADIVRKLYRIFPNGAVRYGYGLTETGGVGTTSVLTPELLDLHPEMMRRVGREMAFLEIRLVNAQGDEVAVGEVGECIARGPSVSGGYYNQPDADQETFRNGWVYTGDLLKKDELGYYYFVDRKKDMIKSGGENIFAQEVESVVRNHPAVQDCAVIGVPDRNLGEVIMAVVKLKSGCTASEKAIQEHCKKFLSSYKKPRIVTFVESFPVDQAGKIQKFKLRKIYAAHT